MENINQENIENSSLGEVIPDELVKYPSPNNPPWGILAGIGLWIFSVLMIGIIPVLFLTPYIGSLNVKFDTADAFTEFAKTDPTAVLIQLAGIIPAHIITLILAWFIVTQFNRYSFKETLGWEWGGYKWWHTILLILGVWGVAISATLIFGSQDNDFLRMLRTSRNAVFIVAFMGTFSAPIVEEVIYRGVIYSAFQRATNIPIAVIITTLIFAGVHYYQYWGDPATIISITVVSLVITMIRVKTNSLLPCIFFHFVFNAISSVTLLLQPYVPKALDPINVESFFFFLK